MRVGIELSPSGILRAYLRRDAKPAPEPVSGAGAALVYSSEVQELTTERSDTCPAGFGRVARTTRFGKAAKALVRDAGALLDSQGRDRCSFLTGTLPGSTAGAVEALAAWSGWVVQTVKQWIRDTAGGARCFGVWEYQKRGALHLHLVVQAETEEEARLIRQKWKDRWIRILGSVGKRSGVDLFERACGGSWASEKWRTRTDAQKVEKSVGCYLSKYLSKGGDTTRGASVFPPSRWWFCDRALLTQVQELRQVQEVRLLQGTMALALFERLIHRVVEASQTAFSYVSPVDALVKGVVGVCNPSVASIAFREVARYMRIFQPDAARFRSCEVVSPRVVAQIFGGRLIASPVASYA